MNEHPDRSAAQIREAFTSHEHLAPDADAVWPKIRELSKTYRRRRRGMQAGGAVLASSMVAAGVAVNVGHSSAGTGEEVAVQAPAASSSASASPDVKRKWAAFFAAGYNGSDATRLAKIWGGSNDLLKVKAEAGALLIAGKQLPIQPSADQGLTAGQKRQLKLDVAAFYNSGRDHADAERLGQLLGVDADKAAAKGGWLLRQGREIPTEKIDPKTGESKKQLAREAFAAAGYDMADAVKLAKLWKKSSTFQVKAEAGQMLLDGKTLPFAP